MNNVGIIGLGFMGKIHLSKLGQLQKEKEFNILAVADIDQDKLTKQVLKECGVPDAEAFTDYRQMLRKYGNEIDAINIATPISTHYSISREVLNHGIEILVEKPCCETKNQALELKEIAKRNCKNIHVGYQLRFKSPVLYAKDVLDKEKLKVFCIKGAFGRYEPRTHTGAHRDISSQGLDLINIFMQWSDFKEPTRILGSFSRYTLPLAEVMRESVECSTLGKDEILNPVGNAIYILIYGNPELPGRGAKAILDASYDAPRRFGEMYLKCLDPENEDRVELYINFSELNYSLPVSRDGRKPHLLDGLFSQGVQYIRSPGRGKGEYSKSCVFLFPGYESEVDASVKARTEMFNEISRISEDYDIKPGIEIVKGTVDSIYQENKAWIDSMKGGKTIYPLATIDDAIWVHNIIEAGNKSNNSNSYINL